MPLIPREFDIEEYYVRLVPLRTAYRRLTVLKLTGDFNVTPVTDHLYQRLPEGRIILHEPDLDGPL